MPINGNEYVFSIGKGNNKYAELIDLNNCETKSQVLATTFLSATKLISVLNYPTGFKVNEKYYYVLPFIDNASGSDVFCIKKLYFSSTNIIENNPIIKSYSYTESTSCGKSTSCFSTDSNYIVCLFYSNYYNWYSYYTASVAFGVFTQNLEKKL